MRKCIAVFAVFLLSGVASAQPKLEIRFPVVKLPVPEAKPVSVPRLTPDLWYVIDSDVPLIVLDAPEGLVKVTEESGPLRIKGKFVDGGPGVETREYKGKHLYFVEAVGDGLVDLIVIPVGVKDRKEIARKGIEVGKGPRPPPDPKPDPVEPKVAPPIKGTGLRVLIIEETAERNKLPPGQLAILFSAKVRTFLNANCAKDAWNENGAYRIWDKDLDASNDDPAFAAALKRTRAGVPWIIISYTRAIDGTGSGYEGPLPKTVDETISLIQKHLPKTSSLRSLPQQAPDIQFASVP